MNQEIKDKWIALLRSGTIQQAQATLQKNDSMCCLGVLCSISPFVGEAIRREDGTIYYEDQSQSGSDFEQDGTLPHRVREWAGLADRNPEVLYQGKKRPLAFLNDSGKTFDEIADLIEGQL